MDEAITNTLLASPSEWLSQDCWLETLHSFNATMAYFNMTVKDLEILAFGGSLEKQFDEAISNALKLFTTVYVKAIPPFFNGVVAGPLREAGNQWIYDKIHSMNDSSCALDVLPMPPEVPDGMINLSDNPAIKVLNFVLDEVVGINGPLNINRIFNIVTSDTGDESHVYLTINHSRHI